MWGVATCLPWPVSSLLLGDLISLKAEQTLGSFLGAFRQLWLDVGGAGEGTLTGHTPSASLGPGMSGGGVLNSPVVTPNTVARQSPMSTGFSRQEYWSGLPLPTLGDLPDPGSKPASAVSCIGRWILYLLSHREALACQEGGTVK